MIIPDPILPIISALKLIIVKLVDVIYVKKTT